MYLQKEICKVLQGSFPGGIPHRSVIKRTFTYEDDLSRQLLQKKISFPKINAGSNLIEIDTHRLNLKTSSSSLPGDILQRMQQVFRTDFSDVRIHTNDGQAEAIGALAFTTGNDIYFAHNQYNPGSPQCQKLIAHELTHVIQQKNGRVKNDFGNGIILVNNPELEADAVRYSIQTKNTGFTNYTETNSTSNNKIIQRLFSASKLPRSKNNELTEFPFTICVIKSGETGQFYLGINGKRNYKKIVDKVVSSGGTKSEKEIVNIISEKDPHGYRGGTANCAEVDALMEAIEAGESPYALSFSTIQRGDMSGGQSQSYFPAKPCGNCQKWLEFTNQNSSKSFTLSKVQDIDIREVDDFSALCEKIYEFGFKSHP